MFGKLFKYSAFALFGLLLILALLYAVFIGLMAVTENRWLGDAPFHAAIDTTSEQPHDLTLIDSGAESLAQRLVLIEGATETLDLEFFIYELDAASRIVTQALAAKAAEGVQVRILVDFSLAVFELRPAYARELGAAGVQVKYYNTASVARFFSVQHRTHRKILIADGARSMIGGRNIADPYFDLSADYNFLDSDVIVEGEVVGAMQESFDLYWSSSWAQDPADVEQGSDPTQASQQLLASHPEDALIRAKLDALSVVTPTHSCPKIRFVTDYPGVGLQNRRVYQAITQTLAAAKRRVLAESPYFVLRDEGLGAVRALTDRGVSLTVLTNSLHSTDAYYTVAPLYFSLRSLVEAKLRLFAYSGGAPTTTPDFPGSKRWGVHSKRAVVDDDTVMIGTYNIDPRSANLNSELMVVCTGSRPLAAQMRADIESRLGQSEQVLGPGQYDSGQLIGAADWRSMALMGLVTPVASLFDILL